MKPGLLTTIIFLLWQTPAHAHPVAFQGAVGVMTWNQSFMSDDWITYSFRPDAAFAARHMRFDMPEGRMQFYAPQLDFLVKRWNESDFQANIYTYGAYGALNFQNQTHGAGLGGIEADAESRKLFIMAKYEKMWGDLGPDFYHGEARLGIAPYEAEFNEIASWFMIQYQWHPVAFAKEFSHSTRSFVLQKCSLGNRSQYRWRLDAELHVSLLSEVAMKKLIFALVLISMPAFAQAKEINITVKGMVCGFCAQGITKKFNAEPAVKKVDVSLEKKLVTIDLKDKQDIADDRIESILKDSGYSIEKIDRGDK